MEDYKDIKDMLKPRRDFAASNELRNRIDSTLDSYTRKRKPLRWVWGVSASCVAAAVLILILIPTGMSAKEILTETLNAMLSYEGIEITVEVRTRPMENFRYINLSDDFVEHMIYIAKSDSTISWRIDKGGRTAAGNADVIYNWIDELKIGWKTNDSDPKELLGDISVFLTPEKILESELQNCISNTSAEYKVSKKDGDIILTVHAQPQGDFSTPYMLNASIEESENIRRYVIDAETKHLKSASVCIVNGIREYVVLKITSIKYVPPRADIMELPDGVRFIDMPSTALQGLNALTATEAASAFLNALETWDASIIDKAIDVNLQKSMYEKDFKGAVLVSVGSSFVSGNENTTFVPYVLRLSDGSEKRHNLALHKSSQGGWIVVGGL